MGEQVLGTAGQRIQQVQRRGAMSGKKKLINSPLLSKLLQLGYDRIHFHTPIGTDSADC
jgi:hypothetical protein